MAYFCNVKYLVMLFAFAIFIRPIVPVMEYIVNYDYIATVLCENKAKPELQCNGKCHLMKELAKASEEDKPSSSDKKVTNYPQEILFLQKIEMYSISVITFLETKITTRYSNLYSHLSLVSFFHPPSL